MAESPEIKDLSMNKALPEGHDFSTDGIGGIVEGTRREVSGIILLSGCSGVGKSTTAEYLANKYGAGLLQVGDSLRNFLAETGVHVANRIDIWPTFAKNYSIEDIYGKVMKPLIKGDRLYVVDCVRFPQLLLDYKSDRPYTKLLHIEAEDRLRFARLRERMLTKGEAVNDEMVRRKFDELEDDITEVKALCDCVIMNNGTIAQLYARIDRFMAGF